MHLYKIKNQIFEWEFNSFHSFNQALQKAHELKNKFGLIGKVYIECSNGKVEWI